MPVQLVGEEDHDVARARLMLHAVHEDPAPVQPKPKKASNESLIEIMGALAAIMGFRIQLFAGFLAAAGLGGYAVYRADAMSIIASVLFDILVFGPLVYVAFKRG